jgi:O-antigen/teichoic acid export membrane protein
MIKSIVKRGFNLVAYNISFYLIALLYRSIVALIFSPEELGNYSLANTLSAGIFVIVGAVSYIYYPKLIYRFSKKDKNTLNTFEQFNNIYIPICYFISFLFTMCIPIIGIILPEYMNMIPNLKMLIIAQLFFNQCGISSMVLIARKKEMRLTSITFTCIAIICICSMIFAATGISIEYWGIGMLAAAMYFLIATEFIVRSLLNSKMPVMTLVKKIFPYRLIIPVLALFIFIFLPDNNLLCIIPFLIYISMNYNYLLHSIRLSIAYVSDNNSIYF